MISYSALADAIRAGYASASTDTGHVGGRGDFALDHPEKLIDFSWRSEHEMTVKAKAIIQAFYGSAPRLSYWNGCSTGGRQGLKEAQKFPDDYDAIIAGAPANRTAISLWIAAAVLKDPASYIPPSKYPVIHQAALAACDARDGLKDGLIDDPTKCNFDPKVLLCKGADGPSCLTAKQVEAAKKIYSPAINPRTGQQLFSSLVPGTELGWGIQALGPEPSANIYDQYRYVVFKDANWDWKTFNFDSDVARGDLPENLIMNATDPEHEVVLLAQREAAALSRLERSECSDAEHHQVLQERGRHHGRRGKGVKQCPAVPGAWNGPLRRRRRSQCVRQSRRSRAVGGTRQSAGENNRVAQHRRQGGPYASPVPVSSWSRNTKARAASTKPPISPARRRSVYCQSQG